MNCPKCGQEMIHINSQYICTACGIVANEFSPRSQVLASIKKKMTGVQTNANTPQEKYISPAAVAVTEKPASISTMHMGESAVISGDVYGKSLDRIAREMVNQNQTRKEMGAAPVSGFSAEPALEMVSETESEKNIPRIGQIIQPQPPEAVMQNAEDGGLFSSSEAQSSQNAAITASLGGVTGIGSGAAGREIVYPSHQVNPLISKVFIAAASLLILSVIGYLSYAHFSGIKGFFENIARYIGMGFL